MCSCICEGTEHPSGHPFLVPRRSDGSGDDYVVAINDASGPRARLMRQAFFLVRYTFPDQDAQRVLMRQWCERLGTEHVQRRPNAEQIDTDQIRARQATSRLLLEAAADNDRLLSWERDEAAGEGVSVTAELLYFLAVLQCAYFGAFERDPELVELVDPAIHVVLPRVLTHFVVGRSAARAAELPLLLEPVAQVDALARDLDALVVACAGSEPPGPRSHGSSHLVCSLLSQLASLLALPGELAKATVAEFGEALATVPPGWSDSSVGLGTAVLSKFLDLPGGSELTLAGAVALVRLLAVLSCPALDEHEEAEDCLKALTTQSKAEWLAPGVKNELASLFAR